MCMCALKVPVSIPSLPDGLLGSREHTRDLARLTVQIEARQRLSLPVVYP